MKAIINFKRKKNLNSYNGTKVYSPSVSLSNDDKIMMNTKANMYYSFNDSTSSITESNAYYQSIVVHITTTDSNQIVGIGYCGMNSEDEEAEKASLGSVFEKVIIDGTELDLSLYQYDSSSEEEQSTFDVNLDAFIYTFEKEGEHVLEYILKNIYEIGVDDESEVGVFEFAALGIAVDENGNQEELVCDCYISDSLKKLKRDAFTYSAISQFTLPNSLEEISDYSFLEDGESRELTFKGDNICTYETERPGYIISDYKVYKGKDVSPTSYKF